MKAENFFYILTIVGIFGLFVTMLYFETNETIEQINPVYFDQRLDYVNERFDRLEARLKTDFYCLEVNQEEVKK